jgi:arylsulfatase A-like enzyme
VLTHESEPAIKYPARVGVTQYIGGHSVGKLCDVPYFRELPENEFSLARALRAGGYATWHVGKWHLGPSRCWPENHGFDVNVGGCHMGSLSSYFSPYGIPTLADGPDGEYLTDRLTDEAIRLIHDSGDRPFFLNLWHYAVHTPIQASAPLIDKYASEAFNRRPRQRARCRNGRNPGRPGPVHDLGRACRSGSRRRTGGAQRAGGLR